MTDEEECYCSERIIEVTTKPPIMQPAGYTPIRQPLAAFDPQAVEFTPQVPRIRPEGVQPNFPVTVHESVVEMENRADHYPATSPNHVIIDMPEPDMSVPRPQHEQQTRDEHISPEAGQSYDVQPRPLALSESEPNEPRCSARERRPPHKFTYDELGKPLILALSSFFESLQAILPQSQISPVCIHLSADTHAETRFRGAECNLVV